MTTKQMKTDTDEEIIRSLRRVAESMDLYVALARHGEAPRLPLEHEELSRILRDAANTLRNRSPIGEGAQYRNHIPVSKSVMDRVLVERIRQDAIWGGADHDDLHPDDAWYSDILLPHVEELRHFVPDELSDGGTRKEMQTEVTQIAAICLAWLDVLERRQSVTASVAASVAPSKE